MHKLSSFVWRCEYATATAKLLHMPTISICIKACSFTFSCCLLSGRSGAKLKNCCTRAPRRTFLAGILCVAQICGVLWPFSVAQAIAWATKLYVSQTKIGFRAQSRHAM
jgi:hypothetical protein